MENECRGCGKKMYRLGDTYYGCYICINKDCKLFELLKIDLKEAIKRAGKLVLENQALEV